MSSRVRQLERRPRRQLATREAIPRTRTPRRRARVDATLFRAARDAFPLRCGTPFRSSCDVQSQVADNVGGSDSGMSECVLTTLLVTTRMVVNKCLCLRSYISYASHHHHGRVCDMTSIKGSMSLFTLLHLKQTLFL